MKALIHKHGITILFFVVILTITGCQPVSQEQPTVITTVPAGPSQTAIPATNITHIYAFGDIFSDNGNWLSATREQVAQGKLDPNEEKIWETYFWEGRASDGPVAVEVLAERLNVGLTDYAILGAMSGYDNFYDDNGRTGLLAQIEKYEAGLHGEKADANSLYFIFASAYDLWPSQEDFTGDQTHKNKIAFDRADQAMVNIANAITHLAESGARQFMVVNSIEYSTTPLAFNIDAVDTCKAFQSRLKSEMPGKMEALAEQLDVTIEVFDWLAVSDLIRSNPAKYGFTEINEVCLGSNDAGAVVCESPDEYFYWDKFALTHHVHQIMGEAMAEQLSK